MPVVDTYWGPTVEPYEPPEYDEEELSNQLSNKLLEGGFDFSGLDSLSIGKLYNGGVIGEQINNPDSYMYHGYMRSGGGMDNAYRSGYTGHYYVGEDGLKYKRVISWDEDKQAMKYEDYDERVYRWSP